jgi:hypothetical protein
VPCQLIPEFNLVQYEAFGGSAETVAVIEPVASPVISNVEPPDVVEIVMLPAATVLTKYLAVVNTLPNVVPVNLTVIPTAIPVVEAIVKVSVLAVTAVTVTTVDGELAVAR